jgi:hypothetical protein
MAGPREFTSMRSGVHMHRQTDLPHVVFTNGATSGSTNGLDGRQKHANQNSYNRNDDQQFDKCKTTARAITH